ncbi:MAG: amidohydrolase family protein [Planctomycetales bacterium]|nr:amidohydrolase family protein [Planctomycetales bacterium]
MSESPQSVRRSRVFRARWVVPIVGPVIENAAICVEEGRVASLGVCRQTPDVDLGDVVVTPGFVNANTHWEFSDLERPLGRPEQRFPDWIRTVIAERKRGDREVAEAVGGGRNESLRCGVTAAGEIATAPAGVYRRDPTPIAAALFHEVIGFSTARFESALAHGLERLQSSTTSACSGAFATLPDGVSPHAPYTVHPQLVQRLAEASRNDQFPVAMHLAESLEELELLHSGRGPFRDLLEERGMWGDEVIAPGTRPLDYLKQLATCWQALVVHGNYLTSNEIDYVAAHRDRLSVAYCPRTHAYFGHTRYPLERMLASGVRVALGTDSRASNPDLDLVAEMRFAAARHPEVEPALLLRMATADAADALERGGRRGRLAVGCVADMVAFEYDAVTMSPIDAIFEGGELSRRVFVAGEEWLPGGS